MWANPFDDSDDDGGCSNPNVLKIAVTIQLLLLFASQCYCVPMRFSTYCVLAAVTLFVASLLLVDSILAIALIALHVTCEDESRVFALSVSLMYFVPFICGVLAIMPSIMEDCSTPQRLCALVSAGSCSCCNCRGGCLRTQPARRAPVVRVPTAQRLLRTAVILGDEALVDLLVDVRNRKRHLLWRLCRCFRLSCAHCQWRCSGFVSKSTIAPTGVEEAGAEERVPRAALSFVYEDDHRDTSIHYLARGAYHRDLATQHRSQPTGWCRWLRCRSRLPQALPQFTDLGRARLFKTLFEHGKLNIEDVLSVNRKRQTSLHCAASTGSHHVLQELITALHVYGFVDTDIDGKTPCEVALERGHLDCAQMLLGYDLSGLSRLQQFRGVVRDTLERVLGQLRDFGPQEESVHDEVPTDAVYEGSTEVLHHFDQLLVELRQRIGAELPREACEALLRFHRFSIDATVAAYSHDARQALDDAGLRDVAVTVEPLETSRRWDDSPQTLDRCMVCFEGVDRSAFCYDLACRHPTCNECLQQHVAVQLAEGDISSIICPEPSCRLPISQEMVGQMFGDASEEVSKLQVLKAQKYVDLHEKTTWCPKPGCTRIVSIQSEGHGPAKPTSVMCACGTQFCFSCKELGGHEPVSCKDWADWLKELAELRKQMDDGSRQWMESNSQQCTCGAQIQRNGGCNQMRCRCGREFCYVCGQDWASHINQTGGLDHYACRLASTTRPGPEAHSKARMRPCLTGWTANERKPARQQALVSALLLLCDLFAPESSDLKVVLQEGSEACLKARQVLQRSYVLRYHWGEEDWHVSIKRLVGELEGAVGALEHVLGLAQLEALVVQRSPDLSYVPPEPLELLRGLDLRTVVPHIIAAAEAHIVSATQQLITAVVLQRSRLLGVSRVRAPSTIWESSNWFQCRPASSPAGQGRGPAILDNCALM